MDRVSQHCSWLTIKRTFYILIHDIHESFTTDHIDNNLTVGEKLHQDIVWMFFCILYGYTL